MSAGNNEIGSPARNFFYYLVAGNLVGLNGQNFSERANTEETLDALKESYPEAAFPYHYFIRKHPKQLAQGFSNLDRRYNVFVPSKTQVDLKGENLIECAMASLESEDDILVVLDHVTLTPSLLKSTVALCPIMVYAARMAMWRVVDRLLSTHELEPEQVDQVDQIDQATGTSLLWYVTLEVCGEHPLGHGDAGAFSLVKKKVEDLRKPWWKSATSKIKPSAYPSSVRQLMEATRDALDKDEDPMMGVTAASYPSIKIMISELLSLTPEKFAKRMDNHLPPTPKPKEPQPPKETGQGGSSSSGTLNQG
jgi:hypothetical protein